MEFNVLIGGEGGQGAFSVELELTEILTKLNYHFFATKHYMSRIRGGHNFHMVRIADRPVHALNGGKWDMVVALDDETEALHKPDLREGGSFLSRAMTKEIGEESRKLFGEIRPANTVLVGCVLAAIGVTPEKMAEAAEPGKAEYLKKGHDFAVRWNIAGAFPVAAAAGCPVKFDGNQALAFGALLGGCRFMAGYPMTPATSILHYFCRGRTGSSRSFRAGRGRDRRDQHGPGRLLCRRPVDGGHRRRRLRAHAGGGVACGDDGNADRDRRRPAARSGHRSSHPDRTGGSELRSPRRPRGIPPGPLRPRFHRRDHRTGPEGLRSGRPVPDPRLSADGPVLRRLRSGRRRGGDPAGGDRP